MIQFIQNKFFSMSQNMSTKYNIHIATTEAVFTNIIPWATFFMIFQKAYQTNKTFFRIRQFSRPCLIFAQTHIFGSVGLFVKIGFGGGGLIGSGGLFDHLRYAKLKNPLQSNNNRRHHYHENKHFFKCEHGVNVSEQMFS